LLHMINKEKKITMANSEDIVITIGWFIDKANLLWCPLSVSLSIW
jgi:hypothetical protein